MLWHIIHTIMVSILRIIAVVRLETLIRVY